MTAAVAPMVAVPGGSDEPADRAAPLDTLLVFADVVSGVLRRPQTCRYAELRGDCGSLDELHLERRCPVVGD